MKAKFCGICHSDLHQIRNDWKGSVFSMVPGYEIVGVVKEVGSEVDDFKVGQLVGIGYMVRSCHSCELCDQGLEEFCPKVVWSNNSVDIDGTPTDGGISGELVCNRKFVLRMPENLPPDAAAPLLCAGITVYSLMEHYGMTEKGKSFGLIGLGGLGHMAVKFAKAFGLKVTIFSTSPAKEIEARDMLGADNFIPGTEAAESTTDYIIDTSSAVHSLDDYIPHLKIDGKLILVGAPESPL